MNIVVAPLDKVYTFIIKEDKEKEIPRLEFDYVALDYHQKNNVNNQTTNIKEGKVSIDRTLTAYLTLKVGLKDVRGLENADGTPYKLKFEKWGDKEQVSDISISELMNIDFCDSLMYLGDELINSSPSILLDPVTKKPIKGVEIVAKDIPIEKLPESKKK